jgi:hypothetical protein
MPPNGSFQQKPLADGPNSALGATGRREAKVRDNARGFLVRIAASRSKCDYA